MNVLKHFTELLLAAGWTREPGREFVFFDGLGFCTGELFWTQALEIEFERQRRTGGVDGREMVAQALSAAGWVRHHPGSFMFTDPRVERPGLVHWTTALEIQARRDWEQARPAKEAVA